MSKSVNEIAKDLGILELSFKEIFILSDSEKEKIELLQNEDICIAPELLREHLDLAGKRCCIYEYLLNYYEDEIAKTRNKIEQNQLPILEGWLKILQTHGNVYEMMGYLTLLQMDALTTTIGLLQAQNDTEKIMLSKHAYTIIYEAINDNLPHKVSNEMHKYPVEIVDDQELSLFWKDINSMLKKVMDINNAKEIRNNIDAHKNHSFLKQISIYKRCQWTESIIYLSIFIKLVNVIQNYMNIIEKNMNVMYGNCKLSVKEYNYRLEQIIKDLEKEKESI